MFAKKKQIVLIIMICALIVRCITNINNPLYGFEKHSPTYIASFPTICAIGDSLTKGDMNIDDGSSVVREE